MFMLLTAAGFRSAFADTPGFRSHFYALLPRAKALLTAWRRHIVTRRGLLDLDPRQLADLGLTRDQVQAETAKPFWRV